MLSLALAIGLSISAAQDGRIPLDSGWAVAGQGSRIGSHRGTRAILLRTGLATRRDVALQDGTIEFDLSLAPLRAFAYIRFRMVNDQEYEEIYFRPHKRSLPDAVQYSPVWNGESNWQLYHGPGFTASTALPADQWIKVRLVLSGPRAALFVGDNPRPEMVIPLGRSPATGYIGVRSFAPGSPAGEPAAAFANLVVRPGYVPFTFEPDSIQPARSAGLITRWQLSPAFKAEPGLVTAIPDSLQEKRAAWPSYEVEPTGILVIGRHRRRPAPDAAVVARLVLQSSERRLQRLNLGFSDYVTVFVNGTPLFAGDAHYSFDQPRQEGLIVTSQAVLWLPLQPGENEVLLVVADGFGGMGLMGQLVPDPGVKLLDR